MKHCRFAT